MSYKGHRQRLTYVYVFQPEVTLEGLEEFQRSNSSKNRCTLRLKVLPLDANGDVTVDEEECNGRIMCRVEDAGCRRKRNQSAPRSTFAFTDPGRLCPDLTAANLGVGARIRILGAIPELVRSSSPRMEQLQLRLDEKSKISVIVRGKKTAT